MRGDWTRVTGGDWQDNIGDVGIFFDPPYGATDREAVYQEESFEVAHDVRAWAIERGAKESYRIVIAGYDEHQELADHGWAAAPWKTAGGYGRIAGNGKQSRGMENRSREVLWFSPHCLASAKQQDLFNLEGAA